MTGAPEHLKSSRTKQVCVCILFLVDAVPKTSIINIVILVYQIWLGGNLESLLGTESKSTILGSYAPDLVNI